MTALCFQKQIFPREYLEYFSILFVKVDWPPLHQQKKREKTQFSERKYLFDYRGNSIGQKDANL